MSARTALLVSACCWLGLSTVSRAELAATTTLDLPETPTQLSTSGAWSTVDVSPDDAVAPIVAFAGPDTLHLAVTRADAANPRAWRRKTRTGYLAEIVDGYRAQAKGGKVKSRTPTGAIPSIELEFARQAEPGDTAVVRILLFRTYTLQLVIAGDAAAMRTHRVEIERVRKSFAPPVDYSAD